MAKSKKPNRGPFKYVRIRQPAAGIAEAAAQKRLTKLSQWVMDAVIEKLEREGLWPPQSAPRSAAG